MKKFLFLIKETWRGESITRAFLNYRLLHEKLHGKIFDLGSGGGDRYSDRIPRTEDSEYILFDQKKGEVIDFECDQFLITDREFDTVLLLNVLEHIYNYSHLLKEIRRIKKDEGILIGFVPFLMIYHADPRDFFRYTDEALLKILSDTGYHDVVIEAVYRGPYTAGFQIIHSTIPRIIRPIFFAVAYTIDIFFRILRPKGAEKYALGYFFRAR